MLADGCKVYDFMGDVEAKVNVEGPQSVYEKELSAFEPRRPIVYLANAYGFSKTLSDGPLQDIMDKLDAMGFNVWEPFQRNNGSDFSPFQVAELDKNDVLYSDVLFAVVNGVPDEGVCVEIGLALAYDIPVVIFRDDFRRMCDSDELPLNLMLFAGCTKDNWKDHYITSIDQISQNPVLLNVIYSK